MNNVNLKERLIPEGWRLKKISEVANTGSGGTPLSTKSEYYKDGDIPWINSGEVGQPSIKTTKNYITKLGMENSSAKLFPKGSVLLAMYGATAGRASLLEFEATTNQAVCAIMPKKGYDSRFIKYYLDALYYYLVGVSTGSARDNLNQNGILDIEIPFPHETTQQKIASVLSALDSKIELNNRINTELEAMAKTLYDYWFVQFDFPDANGKPYKTSGGKMVWNEELKREIPEGWEVKELSNAVNIYDAKRIPLSNMERENRKGKYPYYGATSIMDYIDDYIFDGEYILLAEDGSVMDEKGYPIVQFIWGKTWVNNHAHVLQPKIQSNNEFVFHLLKSISVVQIMTGSIQKKINQENLMNVQVIYPNRETLNRFSKFATPIRKQLINIYEENQKLTELRDWLLPMLMNGQVKVN